MWSFKQTLRLLLFVAFSFTTIGFAIAETRSKALEAYVEAYAHMGKVAALMSADHNTRANARSQMVSAQAGARSQMIGAWAEAQAKLINARAAWITAVANANATDAKTLETLQDVRGKSLDNDLKCCKTFYDKRALHAGYQGLHTRERPTQEDLIRYSKASVPQRPGSHQVDPVRGEIHWPEVLQEDKFSDCRSRLDALFALRKAAAGTPGGDVSRDVQKLVKEMRQELRSKVRRMNAADYVAARRFLESLAYEARLPALNQGLAAN